MTKKIEAAIAALRGRDATAYREARQAYFAALHTYETASKMLAADGARHYSALEVAMRKALAPHTIEWKRYGSASASEHGGGDVNHAEWRAGAHLSGEVWPQPNGGKYHMHMRAHIPFSMSPRDAEEFLRGVALLKAAADAMEEGGL